MYARIVVYWRVCVSVCLYYLCAPACQFGIKLWENEISTVFASLTSWRQGPKRDCIDYRLCLPIGRHLLHSGAPQVANAFVVVFDDLSPCLHSYAKF